jgi:hypothetical protein
MERKTVDRPPLFCPDEIVRIVKAAPGRYEGRYYLSPVGFVEPDALLGREGVVWNAHPAADHKGWRIGIEIVVRGDGSAVPLTESSRSPVFRQPDPAEDYFVASPTLPEECLESTGLVQEWGEGGEGPVNLVPVERVAGTGWRDHLDLALVTDVPDLSDRRRALGLEPPWYDWDAVDAIAKDAAAAIGQLVGLAEEVRWDSAAEGGSLAITDFHVYPKGSVLAAHARVTSSPQEGWIHSEDEDGWLLSHWRRPGSSDATFLAAGVRDAEITCKSYASPGV